MASPAQITEGLPETLPEDFVEWDELSPPVQPVESSRRESGPGPGVNLNSATRALEPLRAAPLSGDSPRQATLSLPDLENTGASTAPDRPKSLSAALLSSRESGPELAAALPAIEALRFPTPRPAGAHAATTTTESRGILLDALRPHSAEITRAGKKKWLILAGGGVLLALILAVAFSPLFNRGTVPPAKAVGTAAPTATSIQQPEETGPVNARSMSTMPASPAPKTTASDSQISSDSVRPVQKNAEPSREEAKVMEDQLHTPTRLRIKAPSPEQAPVPPGGFTTADINGSENSKAIGAVFGSPKQPRVQVEYPQVIKVPSAVALGLLIRNAQPVYPLIAKTARVSGTIVLAATISKAGNVENLRVVSGPEMLRSSAVEAVRTWRFKPYMFYSQPMAIETTINVHFSLH
jgi:TonB family protein